MLRNIAYIITIMILFGKSVFAFEAGAGKATITPDTPQYLAGFDNFRVSKDVHDDLYARCLIIKTEDITILQITLDLIGVFRPDIYASLNDILNYNADYTSELDLKIENMFIISTHNHEAPDTMGLWGPTPLISGVDPKYFKIVKQGILKAYENAYNNIQPAKVRFARAEITEEDNEDSREPFVLNTDVFIMQIANKESDQIIITLENWASHPEALWSRNKRVSADYPGYYYQCIEEKFGGMGIHVSADIGGLLHPHRLPCPENMERTDCAFADAHRIGCEVLAKKVIDALEDNNNVSPYQEDIDVKVQKVEIDIPMMNSSIYLLMQLGVITRTLYDNKIRSEINYIKIGDADIFTIPGELFPEIGKKIKALSNAKYKFIYGLTNDELGYIVPEEQFDHKEYEESVCAGPKAGTIIYNTYHELLTGEHISYEEEYYTKFNNECFIATATFGSILAPEVDTFRAFRDKYLVTNIMGRKFVNFYYKYSPTFAKKIEDSNTLKTISLVILWPLSKIIKILL